MRIAVLGVDLGKNVCSIVGLDASGAVVLRRRVRRDTLIELVAKLPACIGRHGGMLRGPSYWRRVRGSGARRPTDVTRICAALCQGTEERRP